MNWLAAIAIVSTPALAFAQARITNGAIGILDRVIFIMNSRIIPLIILLALISFLYGVYEYVKGGKREIGGARDAMLYGLIGLFVMVSVWGLINFVGDTFGVDSTQQAPILPIVNPNKQGI